MAGLPVSLTRNSDLEAIASAFNGAVKAIQTLSDAAAFNTLHADLVALHADMTELNGILRSAFAPKTAVSISWAFGKQENTKMALSLPLNTVGEKYYIYGQDANGLKGAQLATGQTISVVSADTTIVSFTPDATPQPDPAQGIATVASGAVNQVAVGGPIAVTATVNNADGTVAETQPDTVTVTAAVPGVATSIGVLFDRK